MREIVQLLEENFLYLDHQITDDSITIIVSSKRDEAICPYCKMVSSRVHSTYERRFTDLPIQGKSVEIVLDNRKFFCDNPDCSHTTFAEAFECVKPKAKKSNRLIDEILKVSIEVSSVTASRLLSESVVKVGKSTICNILKKNNRSIGQGKNRKNLYR